MTFLCGYIGFRSAEYNPLNKMVSLGVCGSDAVAPLSFYKQLMMSAHCSPGTSAPPPTSPHVYSRT